MTMHTPRILLVDDNQADIDLMQEAFRECGLHAHFYIAMDGIEAKNLLTRQPPFTDVLAPDFIILDLNLPRLDGRELLAFIKRSDELRRIPTIILTTSTRQADIDACYEMSANTYLVKPAKWQQFLETVRSLERYWFAAATLPSRA